MNQQTVSEQARPPVDLFSGVAQFSGPPEQFLPRLLAAQCQLGPADAAVVLRPGRAPVAGAPTEGSGGPEVLALCPPPANGEAVPPWVAPVGQALQRGKVDRTTTLSLRRTDEATATVATAFAVLVPLSTNGTAGCVAAFLLTDCPPQELDARRQRLEMTAGMAAMYEMRLALERRGVDLERLKQATEASATVGAHGRFKAAAMAFCNHVAASFAAERVCLGFVRGQYIVLAAMSHSEKFTRKTRLVQDIESAMEECLDQDVEVLHPAPATASYIARLAAELAREHGSGQVLSLPLRRDGKAVGVVTLERPVDRPFAAGEIEILRLACELAAPHLVTLKRHDRWIGAKAATALHEGLQALVGPRHTWAKASAVGVCLALLLLFLIPATDKVEGGFTLRATERRQVPAPFEGILDAVYVEPNDKVQAGQTVLARMDCRKEETERGKAEKRRYECQKEADIYQGEGKIGEMQRAQLQRDQAALEVRLHEERIAQATIKAPITGTVLTGDLKERQRKPVQSGEVLFEVAPDKPLWVEINVPESRITDIKTKQQGVLASAANPGKYLRFEVDHISPVAEVVDQQNVFKVRARLLEPAPGLQPGVDGVAKIEVGAL